MKPAQFEMSADTRWLRQRLHEMSPGDFVSYAELSEKIGKPVTGGYSALQSARRHLIKEGYVFSPIRGEGMRRMTDSEVVATDDIAPLRRHARRVGTKLSAVSYDQLTAPQQLYHTTKSSIVAVVATITTECAVKKVEKAAGGMAGELPIAETLRALGYKS